MRIHHLCCGAFRPLLRPLTCGGGSLLARGDYVVHCLLLELPDRLVLVDTGMNTAEMASPLRRLGPAMVWGGGAACTPSALEQVEQLGHKAQDVTDLLLTHLDKDHAGGLADFPQARAHVHPAELAAAQSRRGPVARERYNPGHFAHGPRWVPLDIAAAIEWQGLAAFTLAGLSDVLMVSLPGHSAGHCGVAVQREDGSWLLHIGDAVYHRGWLYGPAPPLAVRLVERVLMHDATAWRKSLHELQRLAHLSDVNICSSHDPLAFAELAASPPA